MLAILRDRTYRHLLAAQVIALLGTGLMTVALGLLAYDLAGADAGAVLGTALAIKMIAYVGVAPVAQAFTDRLPRRSVLVALDLVRGAIALCLPFVTEIWQIYLLIFILQNNVPVQINFLGLSGTLPTGVALLFAAIAGLLLGAIPGSMRILQLRRAARRGTRDR